MRMPRKFLGLNRIQGLYFTKKLNLCEHHLIYICKKKGCDLKMLTYKKDDFDENIDDIMNSINGILQKKNLNVEIKEDDEKKEEK